MIKVKSLEKLYEKLPMNGFKWVNDISGINEKFVKSYDKKIVTKVIYLK